MLIEASRSAFDTLKGMAQINFNMSQVVPNDQTKMPRVAKIGATRFIGAQPELNIVKQRSKELAWRNV